MGFYFYYIRSYCEKLLDSNERYHMYFILVNSDLYRGKYMEKMYCNNCVYTKYLFHELFNYFVNVLNVLA